mmetsp:Transcript_10933/g.31340  ORF Transcript_10933/g.31340 Transcript_10933/m.31340 type:complete len:125 (-) Transcript_10933:878-1252(-)
MFHTQHALFNRPRPSIHPPTNGYASFLLRCTFKAADTNQAYSLHPSISCQRQAPPPSRTDCFLKQKKSNHDLVGFQRIPFPLLLLWVIRENACNVASSELRSVHIISIIIVVVSRTISKNKQIA